MKTAFQFAGQNVYVAATGLKLGSKGKVVPGGDLIAIDMTNAGRSFSGLRRKLRRFLNEIGRGDLVKHSLRLTNKFGPQDVKFKPVTKKDLAKAA